MKQMRNKKARQIVIDYFGDMYKEKRTLWDCYSNPTPHKISAWETVFKVALTEHKGSRVQVYGYNTLTFTVVYYGEVDGVRGIVYVTSENRWLIPDSFIEKVLRE